MNETISIEEDADMIIKIILVGDSSVGKTNLLSRFARNVFNQNSKTTIGVEFATKTIKIDEKIIKAQIWDTAGQERYRAITSSYYKGAHGSMIVYDITNSTSFESISKWLKELRDNVDVGIPIMLIGNKSDLEKQRLISQTEAIKYAEKERLAFLETSAAEDKNVEEAFIELIKSILESYEKNNLEKGNEEKVAKGVTLKSDNDNKENKKCC